MLYQIRSVLFSTFVLGGYSASLTGCNVSADDHEAHKATCRDMLRISRNPASEARPLPADKVPREDSYQRLKLRLKGAAVLEPSHLGLDDNVMTWLTDQKLKLNNKPLGTKEETIEAITESLKSFSENKPVGYPEYEKSTEQPMTDPEKAAIYLYTDHDLNFFGILNWVLRERKEHPLGDYVDLLKRAVRKCPPYEKRGDEEKIYRHFPLGRDWDFVGKENGEMRHENLQIMSCSTKLDCAQAASTGKKGKGQRLLTKTILVYKPKGMKKDVWKEVVPREISQLSKFKRELEVLILPGTKLTTVQKKEFPQGSNVIDKRRFCISADQSDLILKKPGHRRSSPSNGTMDEIDFADMMLNTKQ